MSRSEITVPQAEMTALECAFDARARLVDEHAGFLGLELLRDIRENGRYVLSVLDVRTPEPRPA